MIRTVIGRGGLALMGSILAVHPNPFGGRSTCIQYGIKFAANKLPLFSVFREISVFRQYFVHAFGENTETKA